MDDYGGGLFHHHEGWVLDDGTQVDTLPGSLSGVAGGGMGDRQAEKPWVIFLMPYLGNRRVAFCPSDPTPRSEHLTTDLGWIRYDRHGTGANYIYTDGHVERLSWCKARCDEYPDHKVRFPLPNPPP